MPNDGPPLKLNPVSIWERNVQIDFADFFANLGKAAAEVSAGGLGSALEKVLQVAKSATLEKLNAEQAAALLIGRAIQGAVVALVDDSQGHLRPGEKGWTPERIDIELKQSTLNVDLAFFRKPPQFDVLDTVQDGLRRWLIGVGASEAVAYSISGRLRSYFVVQLHLEWTRSEGLYRPIADHFQATTADAAGAIHAWDRYRARLQKQVDESLLGQPFSLRQTYVPLRAYWARTVKKKDKDGRLRTSTINEVVELDDDLEAWLSSPEPDEAVRMISGGPGSGKSSVAKMFAARTSERENLRVVWVPLHHLTFDKKLEEALAEYCKRTKTPDDFLLWDERVLLIFDGLDELALAGRASQETAKSFVSEILRLVELQNSAGEVKIQVLLSGREVALQEYAVELRRSRLLFLLGHFPDLRQPGQFEPWALFRQDRRDSWWEKHHKATGIRPTKLPEKLRDDRLRDLTSQPLLTVLLALVDHESLELSTPWALNHLYETLLSHVYERKWGAVHPSQRILSKRRYLRILEEIAVGAWHSGEARQISRRQIIERCKQARLEEDLKRFSDIANDGVTRLLTAFYFRRSEGSAESEEVTFEFTHKSFAEYLVARRIISLLSACHEDARANEENSDRGRTYRDLLATWASLLGPVPMEDNIAELLRGEILSLGLETAEIWHSTLERMLQESVRRGLPMEKVGPPMSFQDMKLRGRNAEVALAVCAAAAAEGANTQTDLEWESGDAPIGWIYDNSFGQPHKSLLGRRGLRRLSLPKLDLYLVYLKETSLSGANLLRAKGRGASLDGVDLSEANLFNADLSGASLISANLSGATLRSANLCNANLQDANLSRANVVGADFVGANLKGVDLSAANVGEAKLGGTTMDDNTKLDGLRGTPRSAPQRIRAIQSKK